MSFRFLYTLTVGWITHYVDVKTACLDCEIDQVLHIIQLYKLSSPARKFYLLYSFLKELKQAPLLRSLQLTGFSVNTVIFTRLKPKYCVFFIRNLKRHVAITLAHVDARLKTLERNLHPCFQTKLVTSFIVHMILPLMLQNTEAWVADYNFWLDDHVQISCLL